MMQILGFLRQIGWGLRVFGCCVQAGESAVDRVSKAVKTRTLSTTFEKNNKARHSRSRKSGKNLEVAPGTYKGFENGKTLSSF